jgi:hypothetical protein
MMGPVSVKPREVLSLYDNGLLPVGKGTSAVCLKESVCGWVLVDAWSPRDTARDIARVGLERGDAEEPDRCLRAVELAAGGLRSGIPSERASCQARSIVPQTSDASSPTTSAYRRAATTTVRWSAMPARSMSSSSSSCCQGTPVRSWISARVRPRDSRARRSAKPMCEFLPVGVRLPCRDGSVRRRVRRRRVVQKLLAPAGHRVLLTKSFDIDALYLRTLLEAHDRRSLWLGRRRYARAPRHLREDYGWRGCENCLSTL